MGTSGKTGRAASQISGSHALRGNPTLFHLSYLRNPSFQTNTNPAAMELKIRPEVFAEKNFLLHLFFLSTSTGSQEISAIAAAGIPIAISFTQLCSTCGSDPIRVWPSGTDFRV
ncbi:hypothetical protein [Parendozoicomonas haliclonae]|uniref:hypothetical protein n=1 Tax=Parendozoicomonas haliclonae TaxID=1960125 RepID=UPI001054988C|nr:hypothetical protein [Parendozoicomonas haliclonae]